VGGGRAPLRRPARLGLVLIKIRYVRLAADSGVEADISEGPGCAIRRHMQCGKEPSYSITSSAIASSLSGIVRPSTLTAFRLMSKEYFVGC
jgi:hypothetical protein